MELFNAGDIECLHMHILMESKVVIKLENAYRSIYYCWPLYNTPIFFHPRVLHEQAECQWPCPFEVSESYYSLLPV